jgi:hypothetical protein
MASADISSAGTQFIVPKKRRSSISWSVDRPCPISLYGSGLQGKEQYQAMIVALGIFMNRLSDSHQVFV